MLPQTTISQHTCYTYNRNMSTLNVALTALISLWSVCIGINTYLLIRQSRRETKKYTLDNVGKMSKTIREFYVEISEMKTLPRYTKANRPWYRANVEPYLDFLMWLHLQLEHGLFEKKIIELYVPQMEDNYKKIKPYIERCQKEYGPTAWEEVDKLHATLGIDTT